MPSVYEIVTERIINQLEQGVVPWHKSWASLGAPKNLATGKEYRGINVILLSLAEHSSPYWMTYKQAIDLGGNVRKGEKSTLVVFWKWMQFDKEPDPDDMEGKETKRVPLLRYYNVFNLDQVDSIPTSKIPAPKSTGLIDVPMDVAQAVVDKMPKRPVIGHGGDRAYYRPSTDSVQMPILISFDSAEEYHSTLFHELVHSTGHPSRLGRLQMDAPLAAFGSPDYSKEELVAEMGAAFLCAETGVVNSTINNSAAYIQNWLKALKNDKKLVVLAAAQAQKAADFILDRKPEVK